jgi:hypothetical protein
LLVVVRQNRKNTIVASRLDHHAASSGHATQLSLDLSIRRLGDDSGTVARSTLAVPMARLMVPRSRICGFVNLRCLRES